MVKYWIAVASREHVKQGVAQGIVQVCHGKPGPLKRMKPGDWVIYYSTVDIFGSKIPLRTFTAIGTIDNKEPYIFKVNEDFTPWRRNVTFVPSHEVAIEPLIDKLAFIINKQHWGFPFRRGCFEISKSDFIIIATHMGTKANGKDPQL